jgi:hypothetical protein
MLVVFEKRVLRRISGPKTDEITREWRKLHHEELNDLFCSLSIIHYLCQYGGQDSLVGTATGYRLEGPGIKSRWGEISRTCPNQP